MRTQAEAADMLWSFRRLGPETAERAAQLDAMNERARLGEERRALQAAEAEDASRRRKLYLLKLPITAADERRILASDYDSTPIVTGLEGWDATEKAWAMLCGPVGRGKTFGAACWLFHSSGLYVGARELERLSMAKFGDEQARFQSLLESRCLVIDDIGREDDAGRMTSALLDLVDYRRTTRLRTVAITNFSRKAFEERYSDARLLSRLAECATWIADVGPDMRKADMRKANP
jgi:DNA replication protein DnaC